LITGAWVKPKSVDNKNDPDNNPSHFMPNRSEIIIAYISTSSYR